MSVSDNIRKQVMQIVRTMPGQECAALEKVILASLPAARVAFNPAPLAEVICEIKGELEEDSTSRASQRAATRTSHNETAKYREVTWKRRRR